MKQTIIVLLMACMMLTSAFALSCSANGQDFKCKKSVGELMPKRTTYTHPIVNSDFVSTGIRTYTPKQPINADNLPHNYWVHR